jgi:hypothetical protein
MARILDRNLSSLGLTGKRQLPEAVRRHVFLLLDRHIQACVRWDIEPEIVATIVAAIEDYRLKEETGISVLDLKVTYVENFPFTRLEQYVSPKIL